MASNSNKNFRCTSAILAILAPRNPKQPTIFSVCDSRRINYLEWNLCRACPISCACSNLHGCLIHIDNLFCDSKYLMDTAEMISSLSRYHMIQEKGHVPEIRQSHCFSTNFYLASFYFCLATGHAGFILIAHGLKCFQLHIFQEHLPLPNNNKFTIHLSDELPHFGNFLDTSFLVQNF